MSSNVQWKYLPKIIMMSGFFVTKVKSGLMIHLSNVTE